MEINGEKKIVLVLSTYELLSVWCPWHYTNNWRHNRVAWGGGCPDRSIEYRQAWHKTAFWSLQLNLFGPHVGARKVGWRNLSAYLSIQSSKVNKFNIHISYLQSTRKTPPSTNPNNNNPFVMKCGWGLIKEYAEECPDFPLRESAKGLKLSQHEGWDPVAPLKSKAGQSSSPLATYYL